MWQCGYTAVSVNVDTLPFLSIGGPKLKHRRSEGWKKMRGRCHCQCWWHKLGVCLLLGKVDITKQQQQDGRDRQGQHHEYVKSER